jgi:hypothetical protein
VAWVEEGFDSGESLDKFFSELSILGDKCFKFIYLRLYNGYFKGKAGEPHGHGDDNE